MSNYEEFADQESSGGIDKFTMTVTNAFFEIDPAYSAASGTDTYFLHWEGNTDYEGHEQMDRGGWHPKWAIAADWVSADGGKTVVSQGGTSSKLGKAAGRMMSGAAAAVKAAGFMDTPQDPFNAGHPTDASVWVGTTWFIKEVERDFGGTFKSKDLIPQSFQLDPVGQAVAAAPAAAPAAATPATPAPAAAANGDLRASVLVLAGTAADHATFVAQSMAIPGVASDGSLVAEIVSPTGIYATKA